MNKLLALLLLIVIVSANLRGQTDQAESTEVVLAQAPPKCGCQGGEKSNPVTNSKKMVSFLDYKSAIQALHNGIKLSN
ncbi:hypothetical protein pb186bvf_017790 [Paramecium bursaria]